MNRLTGLAFLAAFLLAACAGPEAEPGRPTDTTAPGLVASPTATEAAAASTTVAPEAPTPSPTGEPGRDFASLDALLAALRETGVAATRIGPGAVSQRPFSVSPEMAAVNGYEIFIFEFADPAAAQAEAGGLSPDGRAIDGRALAWELTPRFYRAGRFVVLFLGDEADVRQALEAVLGAQVAGG